MNIIKLDDFRRTKVNGTPTITLYSNGKMILSYSCREIFRFPEFTYLHFYTDGNDIYIKCDNNTSHAVMIKDYGGRNKTLQGSSKYLVHHLKIDTCTKYELVPQDFGKFKLVLLSK